MYDKIKVLLIDDKAKGLMHPYLCDGIVHAVPSMKRIDIPGMDRYFDLRWLATAIEVREFRDLSVAIAMLSPEYLAAHGWVPEIICFDYALTGDVRTVQARLEGSPPELLASVSPLPPLRRFADSVGIRLEQPDPNSVPVTGVLNLDNTGCFCGGLLFVTFSAHPCAPAALTTKPADSTRGVEAEFFEWLLEHESNGTFKRKGMPAGPDWKTLLTQGVNSLRKRIEMLARANIIHLSLNDLLALDEGGQHGLFTIRSQFGQRHLPVEGLFIDEEVEQKRQKRASDWARQLLEDIFSSFTSPSNAYASAKTEFLAGLELADNLWARYDSGDVDEYARLERLIIRQEAGEALSEEDQSEFKRLSRHLGLKTKRSRTTGKSKWYCVNSMDFKSGKYSGRARRWAALLITVRVHERAARAAACFRKYFQAQEIAQGPVGSLSEVELSDIYLALFPVPEEIPRQDFHDSCSKSLVRLKDDALPPAEGEDNHYNLELKLSDVLAGAGWGANKSERKRGLMPGEKHLLQLYAADIGFDRASWPKWLKNSIATEEGE